ncbi:MAG TPA: hypothetical protein VD735_05640 [Candidatus Saccharimonadales bacterium]|nr:hypothetical protein [Candidatus Saccharimonadales bacterium]
MPAAHDDPKLLEALQRIFITRAELQALVDFQQKLFASLQELTVNHRTVHEHVRVLTDSHNRAQGDTGDLLRARGEMTDALRALDASHRQTREDLRRAIEAITYVQQSIHKIERLEDRIEDLERHMQDDKKTSRTETAL